MLVHIYACMHACMHTCIHAYIHTYMFVVVNFDALAQASDIQIERRQVVFLCWMQDLNPVPQTPNRQQTECSLTNRLSYRGSSKNLNSTALPYDQRAFSPLGPTVSWLSHLALAIYIFVVVNFDALAQASDIQIERRQVVFLCWMQDLNPGPQTPNRQQTECSLTNRLSYRGSSKGLNSTARPYDQRAFSPLGPTVSWLSHLALAIYIFVVVNFDALAQASDIQIERRQVVFLCWMQDLNPGPQTPNRQQTECSLTNRLSYRGSSKNLNSTARPCDQRAFSPLGPTVSWLSHLALAIDIFFVVNFDALAQASDIQIERRQVVFLCWMQDLNAGPQTPNRQQTECSLTNRLSYRGSSKNLNSTASPYDQRAFSPLGPTVSWLSHLALAIYIFVVVNFDALAQASDIQIERRQVVFLCWMQDLNPGPQTPNRQQTECSLTNRLSYRGSSKNLNSTARPYDQQAFSPLGPTVSWLSHLALAIDIFVVLNFDALAQASDIQIERSCVPLLNAGFEPGAPDTKSPADWMLADKPTELSRIKQKLELVSSSLWSASIQPTSPHCQLTFEPRAPNTKSCICLYRVLLLTCIGKHGAIFSTHVNIRQTSSGDHFTKKRASFQSELAFSFTTVCRKLAGF